MVPGRQRCSGITHGLTITLVVLACSLPAVGGADTGAGTSGHSAATACTYSISPLYAIFDPPPGTGSFEVATNLPDCSWFATSGATWVEVTNGGSHVGSGPLEYAVAENATPHQRSTDIFVHGNDGFFFQFLIIQNHPWIPVNFEFNVGSPVIGETVTFTADPRLEVTSWRFGSPDCLGRPPVVYCSGAAGECNEIRWSWADPGAKTITMETTTGSQTKVLTVRDAGRCPDACGGNGPDDGTAENGYGWGTGNRFVQRFTPAITPYVLTDVCVALTQAAADTGLTLFVYLYSDDGPNGGPSGTLGSSVHQIDDVPAWLDHAFYSLPVPNGSFRIDDGSIYIGVGWNDWHDLGFYVAADESPGTPAQTGYYTDIAGQWSPISSAFPGYRSLLLRTQGYPVSDGEWRMVVGANTGGGSGFGRPDNVAATTMAPFEDALFSGTANPHGAEVHATTDGENWVATGDPGFGDDTNEEISTLVAFDGRLYAFTRNPVLGAEVWRTGAPVTWSFVEGFGLGDPANASAPSGAVFDGHLYLGTDNFGGCEIWRSPDGVTWTQVNLDGFGDPYNQVATAMAVFDGSLYVGTLNSLGTEIWKSADGIVWEPAATGGFGSPPNIAVGDLAVFGGALYAGVSNPATGAEIWRSSDGSVWELAAGGGIGDPGHTVFDSFAAGDLGLYASTTGPSAAGAIWLSHDGIAWQASSSPGFTDPSNTAVAALGYWNRRVYAGTSNSDSGCEIWRGDRHSLFEDGFESGDTAGWTSTEP
ncbi:MAG: hypothetical protein AB1Z65_14405 [Candidatus Sulfomarinibacteraceae bacterium]